VKFPFAISKKIIFNQPNQKITSDSYLLNQIEDRLDNLNMTIVRVGEDELFLQKTDFIQALRKKDFLRNMSVKVKTDDSTIEIILKTETILIFIFGLIPYIFLFASNQNFPFTFPIIISTFIWGIGFLLKSLIMQEIKNDLENYLKKMNML
jgi:hypothetical protein